MSAFFHGLLFGTVLQLAIGPVAVSVFQKAVSQQVGWALWLVVGVAAADGLYIALAFIGISSFLEVSALRTVVGIAGAGVLACFGHQSLLTKTAMLRSVSEESVGFGNLRYGFILTLTNPLTILFWGGVLSGVAAGQANDPASLAFFAVGCVSATLLFLSGVACLGRSCSRLFVNPAPMVWLNRLVGTFLLAFALKLILDIVP